MMRLPNAVMKIPVLGFIFGIVVAHFMGAVHARDDGTYAQSPLKPWFDSLKSGKGLCRSLTVLLFQIRIGNRKAAIIVSASTMNGSTFPMMP